MPDGGDGDGGDTTVSRFQLLALNAFLLNVLNPKPNKHARIRRQGRAFGEQLRAAAAAPEEGEERGEKEEEGIGGGGRKEEEDVGGGGKEKEEEGAKRAAHKRAVELERARRPIVVVAEDTSLAELARRLRE